MEETKQINEEALSPQTPNVEEAQALTELSAKIKKLESENQDLKEAKSKYYDSLLNGGSVEVVEPQVRSSEEIRKEMAKTGSDNTNLRNAELSVELDLAVRRETGESSYLPKGHDISPTVQERDVADRTLETLQSCIDEANGDPNEFNLALKRRKL